MVAFTLHCMAHFLFSITFSLHHTIYCINVVFKHGIKGTGLLKFFLNIYEQSSLNQFEFCNAETKCRKKQVEPVAK